MNSNTIILRGITWNHTRGHLPVVATGQRFEELHPEISVRWEKRSLQSFADAAMSELAADYDLIVMDHPHTALAATQGLLVPLQDWLSEDFLADQATNSVGASYDSYRFAGKQWSLAIDAAAPVATWRPDLMDRYGVKLPETWNDVLTLANEGHVTVSAFPIDVLMHSYMFCAAFGAEPFTRDDCLAPDDVLAAAFAEILRLLALCDSACLERNPIRTAEWMTTSDDPRATYCPFAYGYSNYSRREYAARPLKAGRLVLFDARRLRSTLGGAGIAVSAQTKHPRACTDYARFAASPSVQKGIYFQSGGQPGHRAAWNDDSVNAASMDYFRDTLETLDEALVRGKFSGYMRFQNHGTQICHECVSGGITTDAAAQCLNRLYRECHRQPDNIAPWTYLRQRQS